MYRHESYHYRFSKQTLDPTNNFRYLVCTSHQLRSAFNQASKAVKLSVHDQCAHIIKHVYMTYEVSSIVAQQPKCLSNQCLATLTTPVKSALSCMTTNDGAFYWQHHGTTTNHTNLVMHIPFGIGHLVQFVHLH